MLTRPRYVLAVADLHRSAAYYRDVLGFTVHELGDPGWRVFACGDCVIMAGACPDAPSPRDIGDHSYFGYVEVAGVAAFHDAVTGRGAELVKPLRDEPWGMREFGVRTVDGHRILFAERVDGGAAATTGAEFRAYPASELTTRRGETLTIRAAEPADAAALLAYFRRVGAETPFLTFGGEGVPMGDAEERAHIERMRTADNALMLVVTTAGGEIIASLGFAGGARPRTRHTGEFGVSVTRDYWAEGVGRALIEAMLAWATAGGVVRQINLRVQPENGRAIALYERLGFVHQGRVEREILIDGTFRATLLMGRGIDPPAPEGG